jgi:hypothetical protein
LRIDENVGAFDVAMDNVVSMEVGKAVKGVQELW